MSLDVKQLVETMLGTAKLVVDDKWPSTKQYFESESRIFAERFVSIERLRRAGAISEERARSHVQLQKEAWETVLLAVAGLNQLLVEQALNAALKAVQDTVNKAVGFALL